jgi:hypothetical protein
VQTIRIRISKNTDLVVTQAADVIGAWINTDCDSNVMYFFAGKNRIDIHFPRIQDFSAQGHDRLKFTVTRLLGRTAG